MISYAQISNKGDREYNEDRVTLCKKAKRYVFGLADGLGGHGHGDVASALAMEALQEQEETEELRESLAGCFEIAQNKVEIEKNNRSECAGMMTTLTVLELRKAQIGWGHIGDSRIYYFQDGKLVSHTLDQSVPQMLVNAGQIREKDIRFHPDRNRLLRALGENCDVVDYDMETLLADTVTGVLICSDGFWEYVNEREMRTALRRAKNAGEWILSMEKTLRKNGRRHERDNYSAIGIMGKFSDRI